MKTLRYTITSHHPAHAWKHQAHAVVFELHLEPLIEVFRKSVENHRKYFSNIPRSWPRHQEHLDTLLLIEWLEGRRCAQEPALWDSSRRDLIWCYAGGLVYSGQFDSVFCPPCAASCSFSEASIEQWAQGESLFAEGGRRLVCPQGHVLYALMEWNS